MSHAYPAEAQTADVLIDRLRLENDQMRLEAMLLHEHIGKLQTQRRELLAEVARVRNWMKGLGAAQTELGVQVDAAIERIIG